MGDNLGDRMKEYEAAPAGRFMPLLPILVRLDGRCFHGLARRFEKPFDSRVHDCFVLAAHRLMDESGAVVAYTQSDEITLALYAANPKSQVFFDGKIQKLVSVLASICTLEWNLAACSIWPDIRATFDARAWQVPNLVEATNTFVWRELDAKKNSVSMAVRSVCSHKEVHGQGQADQLDMLHAKGINWNNYPEGFKRGTYLRRQPELVESAEAEGGMVERQRIKRLDMPPILRVANRVDVLFNGAEPRCLEPTEAAA